MKPLKVALIIRPKLYLKNRDNRKIGLFSYAVPGLTWDHYMYDKDFYINRGQFSSYDAIVLEDGLFGKFGGDGPPVIGIFWDSTWTHQHYESRLRQAKQCDLVFIGHDQLRRFKPCGKPVRRLSYCVNDKLFMDYGLKRTVDVTYHCRTKTSGARRVMGDFLKGFCADRGYSYRAGILDPPAYARAFNSGKVNVNLCQSVRNRPHRVFDVMAARGCLLTSPLPHVSGEERMAGTHYVEYDKPQAAGKMIDRLLETGDWQGIADEGYRLAQKYYTWRVRAKQLRRQIYEVLKI